MLANLKYNHIGELSSMPRKESLEKRKRKKSGIEALVEPGVGALYVRGTWMKKPKDQGKRKRKQRYAKK